MYSTFLKKIVGKELKKHNKKQCHLIIRKWVFLSIQLFFDKDLYAQYPNKAMITQGISALITQIHSKSTKAENPIRFVIALASSVMTPQRGIIDMD